MQKRAITIVLCLMSIFAFAGGAGEKSNELTIYTSQPEQDIQKFVETFNNEYPEITVNVFRSGTEEVISKVLAEKQTGKILADVLLVADDATFERLKAENILLSYASPELEGISDDYYDDDNTYTGTKLVTTGIVVNTDQVTVLPESFKDLVDVQYNGELVMPSPLYSGAAAYNLSVLTRTEGMGWDFYEELKANGIKVNKGNGSVLNDVTSGEKSVGIIIDTMAIPAMKKGAPLEFIYASEGSLIVTEPIGIVKDSANEENAKLFVDYILSEKGQVVTSEMGYPPVKAGVNPPSGFKPAAEVNNLTIDIETQVKAREEDKKEFANLFG